MRITKEMLSPSREDAVRLKRTEKQGMLVFAYVATVLEDLKTELSDRLDMVHEGANQMEHLSYGADSLLNELRMTIPVEQRMNLQNTAHEYEVRLTPKATPSKTTVIMDKDEFKELVDIARERCASCIEDDKSCLECRLYKILTVLLPLDDYDGGTLCPYSVGVWGS